MKGRYVGIAILALTLGAQGCIFSPRDPDPPSSGEEDTWIVPNTPKDVFLNLASGFASSKNSNYERSLDGTFQFEPRLEDEATLGQEVFENWTKDVELQWLTRVKGEYPGTRSVQFGDENGQFPIEDIQTNRATFEGPYRIDVDLGDGGGSETYAGIARFVVINGSTGWVLTMWEDLDVNGNFPTSGYLRGTLRAPG
jgi:hypothetical protein